MNKIFFLIVLLSSFIFANRECSNMEFFYEGEKISLCKENKAYNLKFDNVTLFHRKSTIYLVGKTRNVIEFLYKAGFRLSHKSTQDKRKSIYTYKLNDLYAENSILLWQPPILMSSLLPKDIKYDAEDDVFTIAIRKKINLEK